MTMSPIVARSPFLPPEPRPPAPRFRDPLDAVAPVSALETLVVAGSPRWAYTSLLASLVGSQRGLSRIRAELLIGHSIDSDRVLADLIVRLDRKAGRVAEPEPVDAPTALLADQRLVWNVAAWSRSTVLAGVCRPVTRSADPFADPRLVAITELLSAGGAAGDEDLLAVVGCVVGPLGVDVTARDGSMPQAVAKAARQALFSASVAATAAELVDRAQAYSLASISRGRPRPPTPPPLRWACGGGPHPCPLDPVPVFERRAMLDCHRAHRHQDPASLGYVQDRFGVWQVDDREPTLAEINRARMHAAVLR